LSDNSFVSLLACPAVPDVFLFVSLQGISLLLESLFSTAQENACTKRFLFIPLLTRAGPI
jgi:hypothetical protein